jgi:hypothetical protein
MGASCSSNFKEYCSFLTATSEELESQTEDLKREVRRKLNKCHASISAIDTDLRSIDLSKESSRERFITQSMKKKKLEAEAKRLKAELEDHNKIAMAREHFTDMQRAGQALAAQHELLRREGVTENSVERETNKLHGHRDAVADLSGALQDVTKSMDRRDADPDERALGKMFDNLKHEAVRAQGVVGMKMSANAVGTFNHTAGPTGAITDVQVTPDERKEITTNDSLSNAVALKNADFLGRLISAANPTAPRAVRAA